MSPNIEHRLEQSRDVSVHTMGPRYMGLYAEYLCDQVTLNVAREGQVIPDGRVGPSHG